MEINLSTELKLFSRKIFRAAFFGGKKMENFVGCCANEISPTFIFHSIRLCCEEFSFLFYGNGEKNARMAWGGAERSRAQSEILKRLQWLAKSAESLGRNTDPVTFRAGVEWHCG